MEVKVYIYQNRMVLKAAGKTVTVTPDEPFSTVRLLVGQFSVAEKCLMEGVEKIGATGLFKRKPVIVIKPCELIEGGLSEVEYRCLRELAMAAGAMKVEIIV